MKERKRLRTIHCDHLNLNLIFQPLEELFASKLQKAIKITEAPDPTRGDDEVDGSSIALSVSCIIRERKYKHFEVW